MLDSDVLPTGKQITAGGDLKPSLTSKQLGRLYCQGNLHLLFDTQRNGVKITQNSNENLREGSDISNDSLKKRKQKA